MSPRSPTRRFSRRFVPESLLRVARDFPFAMRDLVTPKPELLLAPPLRMQHDGPRGYETFRRNGEEARSLYTRVLGVKQSSTILDIGSGVGRKTIPLMDYLQNGGLYVGIDVSARDVDWCSNHITTLAPRFVFLKLDIFHPLYHPNGRIHPQDVVLPFPAACFDFVMLWSVFTHLLPNDVEHYLDEIARVIRPAGCLTASYFLWTPRAREEIRSGRAKVVGVSEISDLGCWTTDPKHPEALTILDESWIRSIYRSRGFSVDLPIMYGAWSNNDVPAEYQTINFQDILVAHKSG